MRTEEITIFKYEELSESAQCKARDWFAINSEYPWYAESMDSMHSFCKEFGVLIQDYRIDPEDYRGSFVNTNADNSNFRGYTLKKAKKLLNTNGNGYCIYFDLIYSFYEEFKNSGDPKAAFFHAIHCGIKSIESDIEYQYSKEAIEELIQANEYEFLESGDLH